MTRMQVVESAAEGCDLVLRLSILLYLRLPHSFSIFDIHRDLDHLSPSSRKRQTDGQLPHLLQHDIHSSQHPPFLQKHPTRSTVRLRVEGLQCSPCSGLAARLRPRPRIRRRAASASCVGRRKPGRGVWLGKAHDDKE